MKFVTWNLIIIDKAWESFSKNVIERKRMTKLFFANYLLHACYYIMWIFVEVYIFILQRKKNIY